MVNQIFRLKDILYSIRKYRTVILSMTLGGLLVGILFFAVQSFSLSDQTKYKIFVSFSVDTSNAQGTFTNNMGSPGEGDFRLASSLVDWVTYIVRSEKVCKTAVERLGLIGVTTKSVQNAISVTPYGETSIMELVLVWNDEAEGVLIMDTILDILPGAIRSVLTVGRVNIIEGPVVTTISVPVGKKAIILFPALGFLVSLLYCFGKMYMHPTLIDPKDVGDLFGVNNLSVIDDDPGFDDFLSENLITNRESLSSMMKDNFTALAHILQHQIDDEYFSLFVTSSVRGEGRTTVVANLGVSLAALDKRVLLIDFDLTSPTLGSYFLDEVKYENTVNAVYFDDVSVEDALLRVSPNLYLLTASLDKRPIGIDRFAKKLVAQLEPQFDVVILDTPPLGENSDTLYFRSVSKNALYVIRYDYADCDLIAESIDKLNKAGTSLLGAVVNRAPGPGAYSFGKLGGDAEGREGLLTRLLRKLPFFGKKAGERKNKPGKSAPAAAPAPETDSFDSDDDLIDTEDFSAWLKSDAPQTGSPAGSAAFRRRRVAELADDADDERLARMEAEMTEPPEAEAESEEQKPEPEPAPAPEPEPESKPEPERKPEPEPAPPPKPAPPEAKPTPPEASAPVRETAPTVYEDEDERLARIYGTAIQHLDERDEDF